MDYIARALLPPKESFLLLGPRGTGKSTWLRRLYPNAIFLDLLLPQEERAFLARPERLFSIVEEIPPGGVCILDEIQRAPGLLPVLHTLIERKTPVQFIVTGSSARKLRREVGNLLGGRLLLRHMPPFLASELGSKFSMKKSLSIGMIPMVWQAEDPLERVRQYVGIYLKEEVQAEGIVRHIGDFARFLEVASFSQGSLWSSSDISRESQVKRQTVDNYLHILEDLLLSFRLPVFTRRAKRSVIAHQKFFYFDVGVFRALRPSGPLDTEQELEGAALESLVAQHLRYWALSQSQTHQFCFWRTQTGLEVDFVLYGPSGFWAVEVKRSCELSPHDVKGLLAFREEYPEASCHLLYGGDTPLSYKGISCLPVESFLRNLHVTKAPFA